MHWVLRVVCVLTWASVACTSDTGRVSTETDSADADTGPSMAVDAAGDDGDAGDAEEVGPEILRGDAVQSEHVRMLLAPRSRLEFEDPTDPNSHVSWFSNPRLYEASSGKGTVLERIGPCTVEPEVSSSTSAWQERGEIAIHGGLRSIVLRDGAHATTAAGPFWYGGEMLRVVAEGKETPAFEARLEAPGYVQLREPEVYDDFDQFPHPKVAVDRSVDLELEWSATPFGRLEVVFTGETGRVVRCEYDAADGEAFIPSEALSQRSASDGETYMQARVVSIADLEVVGWGRIRIRAESEIRVDGFDAEVTWE